jgi:hypothetical protein
MIINKKNSILIACIVAFVFTLSFLLIENTPNMLISYIFTLVSVGCVLWANLSIADKEKEYPWILGIVIAAFRYFLVQTIISIGVVFIEKITETKINETFIIILYVILLAIFLINAILLKQGANHIENVEENLKEKTQFIKNATNELNILCSNEKDTNTKRELIKLRDKIRYSDPLSSSELSLLESEIAKEIENIKSMLKMNLKDEIQIKIDTTIELLNERNVKCKSLK